jgi:hypothetical protein
MSPILKKTLWVLGALIALWLAVNLLFGANLLSYRFWAPQVRDAQREVFERSQSHVQGKVSHLGRLRLAHESADGARREALRRQILTEASTLHPDDLPADLRAYLEQLR